MAQWLRGEIAARACTESRGERPKVRVQQKALWQSLLRGCCILVWSGPQDVASGKMDRQRGELKWFWDQTW